MTQDRVKAEELYELRKAALEAELLGLKAQLRQVEARLLLLEIEREHGLLGSEAQLNIHTGRISQDGKVKEGE